MVCGVMATWFGERIGPQWSNPALVVITLLLLIFGASLAVWLHVRPSRIPIILAIVLPFEEVPFGQQIGYADLDLITPILAVCIIALAPHVLNGTIKLRKCRLETPLLMFVSAAVVASVLSFRPLATTMHYIQYAKVFVFVYVLSWTLSESSSHSIRAMFTGYLTASLIVFLYSTIRYLLWEPQSSPSITVSYGKGLLRLFATLKDPNIAAAYVIPPFILSCYRTLSARSVSRICINLAPAVVFAVAIVLTQSRSGFGALAVSATVWLVSSRRQAIRRAGRIALIIGMVLLGLVVFVLAFGDAASAMGAKVDSLVARLSGNSWETQASNVMHEKMVIWALDVFRTKPWGVGRWNIPFHIGLPRLSTLGYRTVDQIVTSGPPVHNSWIEILASEGIVGFTAFTWIVIATLRRAYMARKAAVQWHGEVYALGCGLLGIVLSMMFYTYDWMYFPWFIIACVHALARHTSSLPVDAAQHAAA
jgi:hypothetical protein